MGKRSGGVEEMTWYLLFTIFVVVLGLFTLWLKKREDQAPNQEHKDDLDEIED
jgi:hypothetical protein